MRKQLFSCCNKLCFCVKKKKKIIMHIKGGARINFRVLQNFTKRIEHRNDVICRKNIDSAKSKKIQF